MKKLLVILIYGCAIMMAFSSCVKETVKPSNYQQARPVRP